MPFSSMILPRTLSTGHAWLSKRVGRSKNRHRSQDPVAMFKTRNDLSEEIRAKAVELLNARLADLRPATPGGPTPPGDTPPP